MSESSDGVEFVGCELSYHADKPTFDRNPSSLESHTHRPLIINGKRRTVRLLMHGPWLRDAKN